MPIGVEELLLAAERANEESKVSDEQVKQRGFSAAVDEDENYNTTSREGESGGRDGSTRKHGGEGSISTTSSGEDLLSPAKERKSRKKKEGPDNRRRVHLDDTCIREPKYCNAQNQEESSKKRKRIEQCHHKTALRKKLGSFSDVDISEPTSSVTNSNLPSGSGMDESGENDPTTKEEVSDRKQRGDARVRNLRDNREDQKTKKRQKHDTHQRQHAQTGHPKKLQLKHLYSKNKKHKNGGKIQEAPKEVTTQKTSEPISSISASGRSSSSSGENSISSQQAVYHFSTNRSDDDDECSKDSREVAKHKKKKANQGKKSEKPVQIKFPVKTDNQHAHSLSNTANASIKKKKEKKHKDTAGSKAKAQGADRNAASAVATSHSSSTISTSEKPKRPLSAYNYFFRDERARILQERSHAQGCDNNESGAGMAEENAGYPSKKISSSHDESGGNKKPIPHRKISFENLGKLIAIRWKNLSSEERADYQEMAQQDTNRYRQEMDDYYERENAKRRAMYFPELTQDVVTCGGGSSDDIISSVDAFGGSPSGQAKKNNSKDEAKKLKMEAFEVMAARKGGGAEGGASSVAESISGSAPLVLQGPQAMHSLSQLPGLMSASAENKPPADVTAVNNGTFDQNRSNMQQQSLGLNKDTLQQLQTIQALLNQITSLQKNQNGNSGQMAGQQSQSQNVGNLSAMQQVERPQQHNQQLNSANNKIVGNSMPFVPAANNQRPINQNSSNTLFQNTASQMNTNQLMLQLLPALLPALQQQNSNQQQCVLPQLQQQGGQAQNGGMNQAGVGPSLMAPVASAGQQAPMPAVPPFQMPQTINPALGFIAPRNVVNQPDVLRFNVPSSQPAFQIQQLQHNNPVSAATQQARIGGAMSNQNNGNQNQSNNDQINQLLVQLFSGGGQGGTSSNNGR